MASTEELETRVKELESWSNRMALQLGVLGYVAERLMAEQVAEMELARARRVVAELTNPYTFNMQFTGRGPGADSYKRVVADAAAKRVDEVVSSIARRADTLRKARWPEGGVRPDGEAPG